MWWFHRISHVSSRCHLDSPQNTSVSVSPTGDGLPVTLTCSSDANPPVHTYAWYRGEACLPSADKSSHPARRSKAVPAGRGRTLSTATAEDYGEHCCVATNRHGSQTDTVTIRSPRSMLVHKKKNSNFNVTINRQRFGICWFWKSSNYQPCLWFIYGLIMTLLFLSATAITPSDSSESRLLPIGLGVGFLLVVVVVAVCFITRWVRHLILSLSAHVQYFSLVISLFLQEEEDIETKLVCPRWDKRSGTLRGCSEKWGLQKQPPEKQTIYFVAFFPKIILCVTALKNFFFFPRNSN